ncbi:MAG TPA: protein kinase [Anaerolineales bacterium]|nr:protein kinase [Anaerolineales bacterium]
MPNLTGQMLGKVRVDMFLARGGMADVFIGTHTTLHRAVAIKFLKGDLQDDPELRERFEREARVIGMLRHPNIVQVHDFDTFQGQPYLIMEYVPGTSLSAYLRDLHKNNQRLDITRINNLLSKLADALKYAHDNDVIHRDIKPANILLTSRTTPVAAGQPLPADVEPIITDFGLVRFTQSTKQTSTGTITGTPAYMSPEQARGDRVDGRTDVYSLAVTVYEMLAGRIPFESDSTLSLLHKQIYDPPPPIEGISDALQEVMNRALAKNPDERFATPTEFAEAFEDALLGTSEASTLLLSKPFSTRSRIRAISSSGPAPRSNRRPLFATVAILGILAVLAGGFLVSRGASNVIPPPPATETAMDHSTPTGVPGPGGETPQAVAPGGQSIGLLRFQDATAHADQVTLTTSAMPLPPEGSQYEAWLIQDDNEQRVSIGIIQFDNSNKGSLTYVDSQGANLISLYHALEITIEPDPDSNPIPSNDIAFAAVLPRSGYSHVRHLLASFSGNPNGIGFVHGLDAETKSINDSAEAMLTAFEADDEATVRLHAEQMLNMIVGNQSPDHKDWNGDGTVDNPSDGFGLLLNGDNEGYIQGTFTHANLSGTSDDATENMLIHGEHVKIAAQNVSEWTPLLRDTLTGIFQTQAGSDIEGMVRQAVALANQIRNGIDLNGNENIEPIAGEGGAVTAYQHAYYMADILLFTDSAKETQLLQTPGPDSATEPAEYR